MEVSMNNTVMSKVDVFNKEYSYIKDPKLVNDVKYLVSMLPDYFFEVPASSTGKYHPKYALGDGGLVRHTKSAVRMAYELLSNPIIGGKYTLHEKDLMIIALILHDGLKSGKEKSQYTKVEHPLLVAEFIKDNMDNLEMDDEDIEFICEVISSHMGAWNKDFDGNEVLPVPRTKYQSFVHMCDYLASRKFINVEFDNNNDVIG